MPEVAEQPHSMKLSTQCLDAPTTMSNFGDCVVTVEGLSLSLQNISHIKVSKQLQFSIIRPKYRVPDVIKP